MDAQLTAYLNGLVDKVMANPPYTALSEDGKKQARETVEGKLYDLILDTVVDNLTDAQITEVQDLDPNSPEMEAKLEEYSATIPNLAQMLEEKLTQEVENLKQSPVS